MNTLATVEAPEPLVRTTHIVYAPGSLYTRCAHT